MQNQQRHPLPHILYKYRDMGNPYHLQILLKQEIFLTSCANFNDPFDCKIPFNLLEIVDNEVKQRDFLRILINTYEKDCCNVEERITQMLSKREELLNDKEYLLNSQDAQLEKLKNEYGLFCVSQDPENLLLWSHYASSHSGICIGFNAKLLYDIGKFSSVGPVTYYIDYPIISPFDEGENCYYYQIYSKSFHWAYECEFRYVKDDSPNTIIKFPAEAIEEIYMGCMISESNEDIIRKIHKDIYPHSKLIKYTRDKSKYSLNKNIIV